MFYTASPEDVVSGKTTDIYFLRTVEVLKNAGLTDVKVRAEFHLSSLPKDYRWGLFTGLKEVLELLRGRRVTVYAMPEGTAFYENEPVMVIEGPYLEFAVLETAILGILRHYSSISTKAARVKKAAGGKTCLFFGARALHPAVQPMADRAAYIGGCDGVATVKGAEMLGVKPSGTMPHALMIIFRAAMGDHTLAWLWFDRSVPPDVPRIVLADTFLDEREEALLAARMLGPRLHGVRLDTPGSRRGNMRRIVEEVRWALDLHGYRDVKIYVSGGLDEPQVAALRDVVDGFGVGTAIAFPPSIDLSMDIVEVEVGGRWVPITKRGKLPGFKQVYKCGSRRAVAKWGEPAPCGEPLLQKWIEEGALVKTPPSDSEIREYVLRQLAELE
ncbi:nicotinate phosphoribosyltransferase [Pyrobaculum neutrophilum]|uniref:nicotinate phosphoribosyltransferase n=1 Tax=Pyrobaculum neutrophilum (strain DSM 2338 / JCM 9278 / NBRC 100436 / V24Sta) TaxID=444157 RepID=B1YAK7_PYRNV|nr:nicotinate phosphoribosyltransferase [Pyrobaculum neutrophilum]ACB40656.1 Quinolinate phosphoribosyl transferase [Pyrobaculum neutrophilum V24Sta]